MKQLRQTIRKLLIESACNKTNNKISSAMDALAANNLVVRFGHTYNNLSVELRYIDNYEVAGYIEASKSFQLKCAGAYIVSNTEIEEDLRNLGIGALLYDVAIEVAGKNGLASDRASVSGDAERMWFYFNYNDDYDYKSFDTPDGRFTKDYFDDDCHAEPYLSYEDYSDYQDDYQSHAFNKAFFKKDQSRPTINCLRGRNLLDA